MNFLTLVNGLRTFVRSIDFLDISNSAFRIRLTGTATADRVVTLPNDTVTLLGDDRPVGTLGSGVLLRGFEPLVTVAASKTLTLTDACTVQVCTAVATITIPLNATVPYAIGTHIRLRRSTSATVTIALTAGVTVLNELGTTNLLTTVSNFTLLRKIGTDTWVAVNPIHNNASIPGDATCITQSAGNNSTRLSNTAFVFQTLANLATQALGNISLNAANTTFVARSCRPIVIATRVTPLTLTQTYTDFAFDNKMRDSSNAYNATTGVFTASYAGIYAFSVYVSNFQSVSTFTIVGLSAVANTELTRIAITPGPGLHAASGRQLVFLNSGDTRRYGVQVGGSNAGATVETNTTAQVACYMSIEYLGIDT